MYYDYHYENNRVHSQHIGRFVINPLGLFSSGDNLFLTCFSDENSSPVNYYVDRMNEVREEKEDISNHKIYDNFDIHIYKKELFYMCAGEKIEVSLSFPSELLNKIIEKFGSDINLTKLTECEFLIRTNISVNKAFFGWLTAFEGNIKIVGPNVVKEKYLNFIKKIFDTMISKVNYKSITPLA